MFLSTQARLFEQLVKQPDTQIFFGMRNADMTWLGRVHKDVMTALGAAQYPAICFQLLDQIFAVHGGYCTHQYPESRQKSTAAKVLRWAHDTAKGLFQAGAMDQTTLHEFDQLCLPPVTPLQHEPQRKGDEPQAHHF